MLPSQNQVLFSIPKHFTKSIMHSDQIEMTRSQSEKCEGINQNHNQSKSQPKT
jgi:hypothetical protein